MPKVVVFSSLFLREVDDYGIIILIIDKILSGKGASLNAYRKNARI